ncbi:secretin N-terminal domain-containing protein [Limihaloglobus sulfuriphilus]|nr:secretin N-terminal domain-containing protein [Limihaloglobus sulfuriphilus]
MMLVLSSVLLTAGLCTAQENAAPPKSIADYTLKEIRIEEALAYLDQLGLMEIVNQQEPDSPQLQFEGEPEKVRAAMTILPKLDNKTAYQIINGGECQQSARDVVNALKPQMSSGRANIDTFQNAASGNAQTAMAEVINGQLVIASPKEIYQTVNKAVAFYTMSKQMPEGDNEKLGELLAAVQKLNAVGPEGEEELPEAQTPQETPQPDQTDETAGEPTEQTDERAAAETADPPAEEGQSNAARQQALQTEPAVYSKPDTLEDIMADDTELELTITLPEKVDITALIDLVGKQLGLTYFYDANEVKGEITFKADGGRITVRDAYTLLESALRFKDLMMSRNGNIVSIVPKAKVDQTTPTLVDAGDKIEPGDIVVTQTFELEHISSADAKTVLQTMYLGESVLDLPDAGKLIVTGYAYQMSRIEKILKMVDLPGEKRRFTTRELKYTQAVSVAEKVANLAQQLEDIKVSVSADTPSQPQAPTRQPIRRDAQGKVIPNPPQRPGQQSTSIGDASPNQVYLEPDERTNRILIIGNEKQIARVNELIDSFDLPQQDLRYIEQYKLEFLDVNEAVTYLEELGLVSTGQSSQYGSRYGSVTPTATPQGQQAQQRSISSRYNYNQENTEEQPVVVVLSGRNTLLVKATAEQHEKIKEILPALDQEPEIDNAPVRVYPLENQSVEDIQETLTSVVETVAKEKAEMEGGSGSGGTTSTTGKMQKTSLFGGAGKNVPDVYITGDEGTNSIVVFASRKDQEWIEALIKDLDKKRPQVLIDVTLVEVTQNDEFEYSLDNVTNLTGNTSELVKFGPVTSSTSSSKAEFEWGGGTLGGFYSDENIESILTLMRNKSFGRIMAKPKLLVNDNQEGEITTSNTEYVANVSTNVLGEQGTNTSTDVQWDAYDAGVTLKIKPHISEGDLLRLEITLNRTDFGTTNNTYTPSGGSAVSGPKDTISSDITTIITVPNKSTIILGGLTKINQGKGGGKVPILGDIPIIGGLFRSIKNSDDQSRLYVFVKANILRPDESRPGLPDLEEESEKQRRAFEEAEAYFQQYQDWPGLDSKPVRPERVLEME